MKNVLAIALLTLLIIGTSSCKKDSPYTIVGKWNVVNDSAYLQGNALYGGRTSNYIGIPGDYFDFTSNGNLFVKKGASLDTATYSLVSATQVQLVYLSVGGITLGPNGAIKGIYDITALTEHRVTLTLNELTPEGQAVEIINLKR